MNDLLSEIYNDPETGLQGSTSLYRKAKERNKNITLKDVKEFLDNQATAQITRKVIKNKEFNTIISPSVKNNFQIDLMDLPNPTSNKNYKYLLTCIDVYSRYVFVRPIKNKTGAVVLKAFLDIIKESGGNPKNINCDEGKEFIYKPFTKYCEENNITLWVSNPEQENKNAIIERFHRTLRNLILRYTIAKGKAYIDDLEKLIKNYNTTEHRTIQQRPVDIWNGSKQNEQTIHRVEHNFTVGDRVRKLTKKKVFDKASSTSNYSAKTYSISKIEGNSIFLDDLKKPFRNYELVHAVGVNMVSEYDKQNEIDKKNETIQRRLNREGV